MTKPSAIVVVIDRLGAAYLGPYGNTWIETPAFNHLADNSILWESAISGSPALSTTYRAYWSGVPAICQNEVAAANLPSQLAAAGIPSTLISDSPSVESSESASDFSERMLLPNDPPAELPVSVIDTQMSQLVGAAVEWISDIETSSLLWLHAEAMNGIWDAPAALRSQFTEEGDPAPSSCLLAPNEDFGTSCDPDQLLSVTHAYAGQICAIDQCLAVLLAAIDGLPADRQPLLILTSPRGFPLGERSRIGAAGDDLFAEVLQVPLFVRMPDQQGARQRIPKIAGSGELYYTLLDHFGIAPKPDAAIWGRSLLSESPNDAVTGKDFSCAVHATGWSLRTPIWFLRDTNQPELFVKPDDRWEVNEISSRCGDVVESLQAALAQAQAAGQANDPDLLPSLAAEFVTEQE